MTTDTLRLIDECPTVVGMMTTVVESGGSLDTAVRSVAADGPPRSAELFSRAVRMVDTKDAESVGRALSDAVSGLPRSASGYRNAMLLCIAASDADSPSERLRLLKEASDVALDSVRAMGERYSASLTVPCMTVFGLGIMVPMILMSIVPLLGIGGVFGDVGIDEGSVMALTLVAIPAAILCLSLWIRRGNPFLPEEQGRRDALCGLPLLLSVPLAWYQVSAEGTYEQAVLLSVAPAAVVTAILMFSDRRSESDRRECERGLRDSVFEIGNGLLSGAGFEKACVSALAGRRECSEVGTRLEREMALCRGDVSLAVERAVGPVSGDVSRAYRDILRCSERDTGDAGRLAMALGRQFHNSDNVRRELESRLKSMKDMMSGTAVLFAPLVLGMSVSMMGPLSEMSGYQQSMATGAVLSIYLVELCLLISVLTSNLGAGDGIRSIVWRFSCMVPVALVVFRICCGISL